MTIDTPHPNAETLRLLYKDFSLLEKYATEDVKLHPADRAPGYSPVQGKQAVLRHERALLDATRGTLLMDVEAIHANESFGAVLGTLRASVDGEVAMPFCGLWRFSDGLITEHWENAYDAPSLTRALSGKASS
ncbi:nuclear transport factor 2 family protein [Actinoallomurus spadix]|nr:nuclear transport factor 2 family protein [Actinoallomurus spadix]MCO5987971.1 nuclear transport factor 2 family protein [Actinoallomurus spadix]